MTRLRFLPLALLLVPLTLLAQGAGTTRVVIITGLSGEPAFAKSFATSAGAVYTAAHDRWHVADSDLVYLAEDSLADRRITGKSTRENVAKAFARLAADVRPGDVILVLLIGHGGGEMQASTVNLPGPDPTAADYAGWLVPLSRATVVFVNAASASGDFVPVLAGPNRIVITATKTAFERNASEFAGFFANGLATGDADSDKDGTVSVAEAFNYAVARVAQSYQSNSRMLTEHAVMADTSHLATRIAFGGSATSTDPRIAKLVGERRELQIQLDSLRHGKAVMDSLAYQNGLETILLQIAAKTKAIRDLQGGTP